MRSRSGLRRTSSALVALLATFAAAQNQRPLPPRAPTELAASLVRVHVRAHERLDVDQLRALARPGVTLWLHTDTNTLKVSTVENLTRFDMAWVELRGPLKPVDAAVFSKLPKVGAWVSLSALDVAGRLPGARRLAVAVEGPLSEADFERLRRARPSEVRWATSGPLDLLTWGQFRGLPGRRVIAASPDALLPVACAQRTAADPSSELHVASLLSLSSDVFPCGTGTRVIVTPTTEPWLLQSLLVRDPSVELVLDVGADPRAALGARKLLDQLQVGPAR